MANRNIVDKELQSSVFGAKINTLLDDWDITLVST